ncbi:MAG: MarR family transcriptional regulator [Bacteroidales bacterium]|nr:MarR family transcriptional regulator [Bacteroidales bacterium]
MDRIGPFLRYFTALVAEEIYNDVRFLTEPDENVWWYDGQRVEFRTPNYARILRAIQTRPSITIDSLREVTGINKSAVQRLLSSLKEKGYIEAHNEGGWRVIMTPSV